MQIAAYGGGRGVSVPLPLRALGLPPYLELGLLQPGLTLILRSTLRRANLKK